MRILVRSQKSNTLYTVIGEAIDCTNGREHIVMILYQREGVDKVFARDRDEFWEKFEEVDRCE